MHEHRALQGRMVSSDPSKKALNQTFGARRTTTARSVPFPLIWPGRCGVEVALRHPHFVWSATTSGIAPPVFTVKATR